MAMLLIELIFIFIYSKIAPDCDQEYILYAQYVPVSSIKDEVSMSNQALAIAMW